MAENNYLRYSFKLKFYRDFLKDIETNTGKDSSTRYMMQKHLLDDLKKAANACALSETNFVNEQQAATFMEEQRFIDEEINKTNEILLKQFGIRYR
jgi:hypothetical protein